MLNGIMTHNVPLIVSNGFCLAVMLYEIIVNAIKIRLERESKPVIMSRLEGLNSQSRVILKDVLTHSFNARNHGVTLDKIFSIDESGLWHRQVTPNNPKDETLIDRIIKAMTVVSIERIQKRENKKSEFKKSNPTELTDEFLINELKTRGYVIFKTV